MQQVINALGAANITSLAVAFIALVGVMISTFWSNWAADKRRRQDQEDEDRRRREERKFEFLNAEVVRQREEVSRCVSAIRKSAEVDFRRSGELLSPYAQRIASGDPIAELESKALRAHERTQFYLSAINATERLRLELVHPAVRQKASELYHILLDESNDLARLRESDINEWLDFPASNPYISGKVNKALVDLVHSAFRHLHFDYFSRQENNDV